MSPDLDPERAGDHLDRLFRAAWALTGNREEAEDVVQETYVRVLSRPRFLRNEDDLGYLLRALRNTFLTMRRDAGRRIRPVALPDEPGVIEDRSAVNPHAALEAREVYAAVAALPDDYRDTIVAVDIAGLSYKEAAKALGTKEGTIMSRLSRARSRVVATVEGE
jgi:RNA polymerase sigma-70 factor (ECF subfamily)